MKGATLRLIIPSDFDTEDDIDRRYEAMMEQGDFHATQENYPQASRCFHEAASLVPNEPGPHVALGIVAMGTGKLDEAKRFFETAVRKDFRCKQAYGGLAMVYQRKKEYAAAFDIYLKCLELDADNLIALLGLFQTSCQMGTFSKVIHYLRLFLAKHPDDSSVLFCLAALYAREGELENARDSLTAVLAIEPDKTEAAKLLAEVERGLADVHAQMPTCL